MKKALVSGLMLLASSSAWAGWSVDNNLSRVNFVSVKNNTVGEAHHFKMIKGSLSKSGQLEVEIPLASVETLIPIRNERMQKMLFETKSFPTAMLSAKIDKKHLKLAVGHSKIISVEADLGLHGVNVLVNVEVMVTKVAKDKLQAVSVKPIIIRPADFGLDKGVDKLQAVAGLSGITQAVPVNFVLTLTK